jgi:hypothetical protein
MTMFSILVKSRINTDLVALAFKKLELDTTFVLSNSKRGGKTTFYIVELLLNKNKPTRFKLVLHKDKLDERGYSSITFASSSHRNHFIDTIKKFDNKLDFVNVNIDRRCNDIYMTIERDLK